MIEETKMDPTVSNPWGVLPIKNAKYAKSCSEIHLSDRGIEKIDNFSSFTNLEVLWLNNNKIRRIENLDENFRIKELYIENNCLITLDGSIKYFKFLQKFLAGNNNLRGLDNVLKILCKFSCLEHLNLYGNPCAEEPYYRMKVIATIPSLKILDRHDITVQERIRAQKLLIKLSEGPTQSKPKQSKPKASTISTGERALAHEVKEIKIKNEQKEAEEEKNSITVFGWDKYQGKPAPIAKKVLENAKKFWNSQVSRAPEWENAEEEAIKNEIKSLYAKAKKEEMYGRMDGAKEFAFQALRLQGILDKREKPVEEVKVDELPEKPRTDFVKIFRYRGETDGPSHQLHALL
ncbi:LRRC72 [Blepharisma stoltei]|uniref:U2A'/phosphoprotein 32 family A C-terminal domain-containing protein n=1 Tax=Blepharisma stoltei TaxID=1481888 RepID=A0AAU9JLL6_9CILI|nr:unnamed protein product [Blepharisma stoltei]